MKYTREYLVSFQYLVICVAVTPWEKDMSRICGFSMRPRKSLLTIGGYRSLQALSSSDTIYHIYVSAVLYKLLTVHMYRCGLSHCFVQRIVFRSILTQKFINKDMDKDVYACACSLMFIREW